MSEWTTGVTALPKESEVFSNPVRAQLITADKKPCTYFAEYKGRPVFVKGPYATSEEASEQFFVHAFKRLLDPEIPYVPCEVLQLEVAVDTHPAEGMAEESVPDPNGGRKRVKVLTNRTHPAMGFLGLQDLGDRRRWISKDMKGKPGWFLVCDDYIRMAGLELKTHMRDSAKWPVPIPVVNFEAMRGASRNDYAPGVDFQHAWYNYQWDESMYTRLPPHMSRQFVLHMLYSWVCGCGADWAMTNFFVFKDNLYQIDLEAWAKYSFVLSDTTPGQIAPRKGQEFLIRYVNAHWEDLQPALAEALKNLERFGTSVFFTVYGWRLSKTTQHLGKNGMVIDVYPEMVRRLTEMQTKDGLLHTILLTKDQLRSDMGLL